MYVKKINDVKDQLLLLKEKGIIKEWELPYENLLTRLDAAIFFVSPAEDKEDAMSGIEMDLERFDDFSYRVNHEKKLSRLPYRVTFNKDEKIKNETPQDKLESQEAK